MSEHEPHGEELDRDHLAAALRTMFRPSDHPPGTLGHRIESRRGDDRLDPMPDSAPDSSEHEPGSEHHTLKRLLVVALGLAALGVMTLVASMWLHDELRDWWWGN